MYSFHGLIEKNLGVLRDRQEATSKELLWYGFRIKIDIS